MTYLLDADVFIESKKRFYGLDFCPAFWDWLIAENAAGRVASIEKVRDEIDAGLTSFPIGPMPGAMDSLFVPIRPFSTLYGV